jgi:[ribosomal protein S5]-alanine N-acetyltransferase
VGSGEVDLPSLSTSRLDLRPATTDDAEALFAFELRCAEVPEASRFLLRAPPASVDELRARMAHHLGSFSPKRTGFTWVCRPRADEQVVGYAAFVRWNHEHHGTEIAYVIEPAMWGKGLAVEACSAIVDFAFRELPLHRVEARIDPDNKASIRVAQKLGFVLEGTLKESFFGQGRYFDTAVYAKVLSERRV